MEIFLTRSSSCKVWWILWRYLYCYLIVGHLDKRLFLLLEFCVLWGFKMRLVFIHSPSAYWVQAVGYANHSIDWVACVGKSFSHDLFSKVWCRVSRRGNIPCQLAVGSRGWCSDCSWVWCLLDKRPVWWRIPPSRQRLASVISDSAQPDLAPVGLCLFSLIFFFTSLFVHLCSELLKDPYLLPSFSGGCIYLRVDSLVLCVFILAIFFLTTFIAASNCPLDWRQSSFCNPAARKTGAWRCDC